MLGLCVQDLVCVIGVWLLVFVQDLVCVTGDWLLVFVQDLVSVTDVCCLVCVCVTGVWSLLPDADVKVSACVIWSVLVLV